MNNITTQKESFFNLKDKTGWAYLPILLYFAYLFAKYVENPHYWSFLNNVNLIFHEAGHLIFMFFGEFVMTLGGSLFECLLPLLLTIPFFISKNYFGVSFCLCWLSVALFDVSLYISDAQERALPLLGGNTSHDWNYLLNELGVLAKDDFIAGIVRIVAIVTMLAGLFLGVWLIWTMHIQNKSHKNL